jgi:glycosyltransferase involved in cell wall biosynthesis
VYNGARYLDALQENLSTLEMIDEIEVIIVDDGSTDGSSARLRQLAEALPHGVYLSSGSNVGPAGARNLGLAKAGADYVWFIDCDDSLDPSILRRLHGEIVATDADLAICQADLIAESGDLLRHLDRVPRGGVIDTAELADRILTGTVNGYLANKLFRRALLSPAGFPTMSLQEDIVGIISILPTIGRTVLIAETLFFHIEHAGSLTTRRNPDLQNLRRCAAAMDGALAQLGIPRDSLHARYFHTKMIRYSICNTGYRLSTQDRATVAIQEKARREITMPDVIAVAGCNIRDGVAVATLRYARPLYQVLLTRRWKALGSRHPATAS